MFSFNLSLIPNMTWPNPVIYHLSFVTLVKYLDENKWFRKSSDDSWSKWNDHSMNIPRNSFISVREERSSEEMKTLLVCSFCDGMRRTMMMMKIRYNAAAERNDLGALNIINWTVGYFRISWFLLSVRSTGHATRGRGIRPVKDSPGSVLIVKTCEIQRLWG